MIKELIHQEDIPTINIYAPNIGAPEYIKQILTEIKRESDSNTLIVGDFNIPLTSVGRSFRQKINKEVVFLNDTSDQMDLTDIHRTFHPKLTEYTFFSIGCGTFSRIDHIWPQNKSQ